MPVIRIATAIAAPAGRCFDLARDVDFHVRSLAATGARAEGGRTGLGAATPGNGDTSAPAGA